MRAKKYVVIYAVAAFLIIFLITFNSVCAITQFDVKYNVGSAQMTQAAQRVQSTLEDRYLNKSYLFFKDSDIRNVVAEEGKGYLEITDICRTFPNKISVTVREKFENYAFVSESADAEGNTVYTYYAVGDDGTVLAVSSENKNNIFGRNIEIAGFEFPAVQVGETFAVNAGFEDAYSALQTCFSILSSNNLRGNILRIEYDGFFELPDPADWFARFIIDCKEGVQIIIPDPQISTQEKAEKAFAAYVSLGEQFGDIGRMEGRIEVTTSESGEISAVYSPSESPETEAGAQA